MGGLLADSTAPTADDPPSYTDREEDTVLESGPTRPWSSQPASESSHNPPAYYQHDQNVINPRTGRPWPNDSTCPQIETAPPRSQRSPQHLATVDRQPQATVARGYIVNPVTGRISAADPNSGLAPNTDYIHEAWVGSQHQTRREPSPKPASPAVGYIVNPVTGRVFPADGGVANGASASQQLSQNSRRLAASGSQAGYIVNPVTGKSNPASSTTLHTRRAPVNVMHFITERGFLHRGTLVVLDGVTLNRRYFVDYNDGHAELIVHSGADASGPQIGTIYKHPFSGNIDLSFASSGSKKVAMDRDGIFGARYAVVLPACPAGTALCMRPNGYSVLRNRCLWKHSSTGEGYGDGMKLVDGSEKEVYAVFTGGGRERQSRLSILMPGLEEDFVNQIVVSVVALIEKQRDQKSSRSGGARGGASAFSFGGVAGGGGGGGGGC